MSAILMFPATQIDSLSALTQVFVRAFINDSGTQYICQHRRAGYEGRLYGWFYGAIHLQIANQQPILTLMVDGNYSGGALLTAPNATLRPSSLKCWLWDVWQKAGTISVWRTLAHLRHLAQHQPKAPHIRLEFLAVEPHQQGKGYGRDLLEAIHTLSEKHPQSTGVWLETANPNNILLYERFGYHITGTGRLDPAIETIMMFRPNRGGKD